MFGQNKLNRRINSLAEYSGILSKRLDHTQRLLKLADITEVKLIEKLLEKLGPGWRCVRSVRSVFTTYLYPYTSSNHTQYCLWNPQGGLFSSGDDRLTLIEVAILKKEEAIGNFCNKPKKSRRKK